MIKKNSSLFCWAYIPASLEEICDKEWSNIQLFMHGPPNHMNNRSQSLTTPLQDILTGNVNTIQDISIAFLVGLF